MSCNGYQIFSHESRDGGKFVNVSKISYEVYYMELYMQLLHFNYKLESHSNTIFLQMISTDDFNNVPFGAERNQLLQQKWNELTNEEKAGYNGEDRDVKSLVVSRLNRIKKEVCVPPIIFSNFDLKFYLVVVNCMYVGVEI